MNYCQRLESLGWKRTNGNSRLDFYRKHNWLCIVPSDIRFPIRFEKVK